ncbi:MAG: FliM/FliN family flagellar motor switch protein [Deltaproteobacteria bacterium]|nr:FliM/FliN family flagellar motor switch protein [Deltaproteobacteria bacterium]
MANNPDDSFEIGGFEGQEDPFANEGQDFFDTSATGPAGDMGASMPHIPTAPPLPSTKAAQGVDKKVVNLTGDIPVQIVAVLGKKSVTVKDIVSLRMGEVIELNRLPNEAIDLVANGKLIAKGELVDIDGRLGVRILKIFD